MPTYTYQCLNCDYHFDIFQHFTEDSLVVCPKCGQPTLHKVYAPVGIVFKGSGFYSTDNRSPSGQLPIHHENSTEKTGDSESSEHKSEPDGGEKKETPKQKSESSKASVEKSEPSKTEPKT